MKRLVLCIIVGIIAPLTLSESLAFAQPEGVAAEEASPTPNAYEHFQRGQVAYEQGEYQRALDEWNAAYELDPRHQLQYNLAQAHERLGQLSEASEALDVYLEQADENDPNLANARARRTALRDRVGHTGIQLVGGPAGASIRVDGEDWGMTPRPDRVLVTPGSHRLLIEAEGYEPFRASVVVPAGDVTVVQIEMQASSRGNIAPWLVVGAGGVLVVTAAVLGGVAASTASSAPSDSSDEADSARSLALGADILGIAGAAAISAGLIWYFVSVSGGDDEPSEDAARISPVVTPQVVGMNAQVNF